VQVLRSGMPPKRARSGRKPRAKRYKRSIVEDLAVMDAVMGGPAAAAQGLIQLRRRRTGVKSGARKSYGRKLVRPSRVPVATAAVKKQVFTQADLDFWDQAAMQPAMLQLKCRTPDYVWADYSRGFDVKQVISSQIKSRNITCQMRLKMPQATTAPQPYQFRIIQGFVKSSITGKTLSSTVGQSGMDDGIVLNFLVHTAYDDYARQVLADNVGTTNGTSNFRGLVNSNQILTVTDQNITVAADGTRENPAVPGQTVMQFNREIIRTFNWKTGNNMKLYPYSVDGNIPAVPNLTPVNNPRLWTPFVAVILLNHTDYTVQADSPLMDLTWSHYWQNL
jgi:hypothetical protein